MQKIPTIFERDWDGDRSRVLPVPSPGCEWVFAGEGVATRKYDGTACAIIEGKLYRRSAIPAVTPEADREASGFVFAAHEPHPSDERKDKDVGWVPVGDGPEDRWAREAVENHGGIDVGYFRDGTYELLGPKVQGNPENATSHQLLRHEDADRLDVSPDFDALAVYLATADIEGIVWHHPDGRMAKIKGRDFGHRRPGA